MNPEFYCEMALLNIIYDRKGISEFPHTVSLYSFMNTSRVRSSHQRCSVRKDVIRNFAKFTGKHRCFTRKHSKAQVFSGQFAKFLRTPFLQNTSWWLLAEGMFIPPLKSWLLNLELAKVQTGKTFARGFWCDELFEYIESKFKLCFYWPIQC